MSTLDEGSPPTKSTTATRYALADCVGYFLKLLQLATEIKTLETQQQLILVYLYTRGEVNQGDLDVVTGVGRTSNGRNLDRLGRGKKVRNSADRSDGLGWVETVVQDRDSRFKTCRLTALGRSKLNEIFAKVEIDFTVTAVTKLDRPPQHH